MTRPYQLTIPTGVSKSSKRVLATIDKACGSGSGGGDCIGIDCRVCVSYTLDFTFGGALSGIGVITITGVDTGSQYLWEDPPASSPTATILTSCGGLRIFFQISYDGTATLQIRLNGVLIVSRTSSMRVCEAFAPGDPTEFIYPQSLVDGSEEEGYGPDFTVVDNEDGCNGEASITVTNTSDGAGSGSTNPYDFAVDTLLTKEGLRILAAVDCAAAGSGPNLYWYGVDTGLRKNGKRILAGYDPCCAGANGINFLIGSPCCPNQLPRRLYLTGVGSLPGFTGIAGERIGTIELNYSTDPDDFTQSGCDLGTASFLPGWVGSKTLNIEGFGEREYKFKLFCDSQTWVLCCPCTPFATSVWDAFRTDETCNPLSLVFGYGTESGDTQTPCFGPSLFYVTE
jgi:hypothetical protein